MALLKRGDKSVEPLDVFGRFDRMFDEWTRALPFRGSESWWSPGEDVIRIDEFRDGDTLVVRAELPGIDPDKDVELTVSEGMLHVMAERRMEEEKEEKGFLRRELRYGRFARTLPLPEGVTEADISARYKDGILEIRIPVPKTAKAEPKKITVNRG